MGPAVDREPRPVVLRATVALVAALAGCAPLASFRPASGLMEGRSVEGGVGAVAVSPRPFVQEDWHGMGHAWVTGRATDWLVVSGILAFDDDELAGGGAARLDLVDLDRFAGGVEVELGWAWGAFVLPMAVRLFDETWLYASPRIGTLGDEITPGIPVGFSVRLYEGLIVRLEGQASWAAFEAFERRFHLGLAVANQW